MELSEIKCRVTQIKGFEDYYITEEGDVYSTRLTRMREHPKLRKLKPKNPGKDNKYLNIILCKDNKHYTKSIHRLVAEHFVDGYFEGAVVNHIDGNNRNNKSNNLEWVTQKENIIKSYATSNLDQTRNYMWWSLIDPQGVKLGEFKGNAELGKFIKLNNIKVSYSSLVRYGKSVGFKIEKRHK